ncbi:MAG TPA: HAMP domain-containing sensor histidine kinase [Gemmatimonadales bacterium]|nr:HAMP domain-containing sensor histidine kinase [Gemmatimonadales bacterium]
MPERRRPIGRLAPTAAVLLVALLAGLSLGTAFLVARHFGEDAQSMSRLYSGVYSGLNSSQAGGEADALLRLGEQVRRLGMPLVVTDSSGTVTAADNLPSALRDLPLTDARIQRYVAGLDASNRPLLDSLSGQQIHYGPLPAKGQLTALAVLQAFIILIMVAVAAFAYRSGMSAERDRLWVAMAREAAHQLGTPLMSLQGWIESLRGRPTPPQGLAEHLAADAERLERVAKRFERIGNPARREPVGLGALAERVAEYFRPRLPQHANRITLRVVAPGAGPTVTGDPVLLEWTLEALVKNAIDALQGREGNITLRVGADHARAELRVSDDGPGVSREMRRSLFEPGASSKQGGWGIGLALARRVVEDAHGGELMLEPGDHGATFVVRLPLAEERS